MKRKFIINKAFSINSDEDFRDYAHNLMMKAHGDDYSEEVTDKAINDLLNDNPGADYGELIGRLTSGFGQKNFAESKVDYYKRMQELYDGPNGKNKKIDSNSQIGKAELDRNHWFLELARVEAEKEDYEKKAKEDLEKNLAEFDSKIAAISAKHDESRKLFMKLKGEDW